MRRTVAKVVSFGLVLSSAGAVAAQTKPDGQACTDSYVANQRLRKDGKLVAAKKELLVCAQESCPKEIQSDCSQWLRELDENLPTIVVAAQSGGQDVLDVQVSIDGAQVQSALDGLPIAVDPGPHLLAFDRGGRRITQQILAQQGVKNRAVNVSFDPALSAPPPAPSTLPSALPASSSPSPTPAVRDAPAPRARGELIAGGVVGGLAIAGAGMWIGLGLAGKSKATALTDRCGPGTTGVCSQSEISAARALLIGADVSMGVTIAAAAVSLGLLIHYATSAPAPKQESTALALGVAPVPGGANATLKLAF